MRSLTWMLSCCVAATITFGCAGQKGGTLPIGPAGDATDNRDAMGELDGSPGDGVGDVGAIDASDGADNVLDTQTPDDGSGSGDADAANDVALTDVENSVDTDDTSDVADTAEPETVDAYVDTDTTPREPCDGQRSATQLGDELLEGADWVDGELSGCAHAGHVLVMSADSRWRVEAIGLPAGARLDVFTPHYLWWEHPDETLVPIARSGDSGLVRDVSFSPPFSGEVVVRVTGAELTDDASDYEIRAFCTDDCEHVATRFPLILVHGLAGTNNYFGLFDYWYQIGPELDRLGIEYRTLSSRPFDSSEDRAVVIEPMLRDIIDETGARKLNLYGHSQGGLDSRILASPNGHGMGDVISSITTLATPHRGVPIRLTALLSVFGIQNFDEPTAALFNAVYDDAPDVAYYSWGGRTCGILELGCIIETGGEVVDVLLSVTYTLIKAQGYENDGLVTVESSKWGTYLGTLNADHMDEIGQIIDDESDTSPFNQVAFFRDEVFRLIDGGH